MKVKTKDLQPLPSKPFMDLHSDLTKVVYNAWAKQMRDYAKKCVKANQRQLATMITLKADKHAYDFQKTNNLYHLGSEEALRKVIKYLLCEKMND